MELIFLVLAILLGIPFFIYLTVMSFATIKSSKDKFYESLGKAIFGVFFLHITILNNNDGILYWLPIILTITHILYSLHQSWRLWSELRSEKIT
jgi:hypothetical protein